MRKKKDRKGIRLRRKQKLQIKAVKVNISREEMLKALCTHRDAEGKKLIMNADGTVTCKICGKTFTPVMTDQEVIKRTFDDLINCLETMKLYLGAGSQNPYIEDNHNSHNDIFANFVHVDQISYPWYGEYRFPIYTTIPLAAKAPSLYQIASDHYKRYSPSSFKGTVCSALISVNNTTMSYLNQFGFLNI